MDIFIMIKVREMNNWQKLLLLTGFLAETVKKFTLLPYTSHCWKAEVDFKFWILMESLNSLIIEAFIHVNMCYKYLLYAVEISSTRSSIWSRALYYHLEKCCPSFILLKLLVLH